ncbi:relA-associated inhibitor isoform X2 [Boleophthalmus pectinirostris]|uniref:relA-associated inhibitor isoform X2 n=1 Tax=Boleophthalmus pectinirostris TaxID=150288 RepID=UPI002431E03B|nr:relA-associated inhibitor isoform X2 [Boleophthalmus pectinirostris]
MTSQAGYGSSMLFRSINEDLNASLATADELSKEFSSLLKEVSSDGNGTPSQTGFKEYRETSEPIRMSSTSVTSTGASGSSTDSYSSQPFYKSPNTNRSLDSVLSDNRPVSPAFSHIKLPPSKIQWEPLSGPDSFSFRIDSPKQSPKTHRRNSPVRSPRISTSYMERSVSPIPSALPPSPRTSTSSYSSSGMLSPYDNAQMGRRSPRPDRSPSPLSFNHPISSTLPRNFRPAEETMQRQKSPSKWSETDLDMSYERKPHHTYDKTDWLRPMVPSSSWRESNLDGPLQPSPKKESRSPSHQSYSSLPRTTRIAVPPDASSQGFSPYLPQPIISRISMPPTSTPPRQRRPIPLSVIMRLQNPHLSTYQPAVPLPREYFFPPAQQPQQRPPELRQPPVYSDALNPSDVDAELEAIDMTHHMSVIDENTILEPIKDQGAQIAPRPLSPTRLQPVVAPEAQVQEIPNLEELLAIRAEIPRALKRRGSMDQTRPLKSASRYEPNQYKHLISNLFRKKERHSKGDPGSDDSSSDEEEFATPPSLPTATMSPHGYKSYQSILRKPRERKSSGKRARLSPLVLALDGALVGELDTVQRAMQEMNDPSQPNDEGITALHNAICGGHYNVVDFLVRIGANVSAPDSHGWTPLHCAASCNDRNLCEFLVRNGAAVMAVTESDWATASQKCDPFAVGFEECENFLRGVEEAMGVENSGVLYALWSYPAQAPDELSFKDGDMVTILQKQEGSDWWWASLCGREGFVPNNYFGLFPKVRPKTMC